MIMKGCLPDSDIGIYLVNFFCNECFILSDHIRNICRSSCNNNNCMDVIWHHNKLIYFHALVVIRNLAQSMFRNDPHGIQLSRGSKNTFFLMGAYRDEVIVWR